MQTLLKIYGWAAGVFGGLAIIGSYQLNSDQGSAFWAGVFTLTMGVLALLYIRQQEKAWEYIGYLMAVEEAAEAKVKKS